MSGPGKTCLFDLLDAAMRNPFLQQAFRQLDQRHLYGIIARVCRSWHHLSITSSSSLTVKVSTRLNEETGEPDAAISFSKWLQHNIGNLTRLDLTLNGPPDDTFDASEMLQTITSATQLCSLRLDLDDRYLSESFAGVSALTNLTSLALCGCDLSPLAFSSTLALSQLRALDLRRVGVYVNGAEEEDSMADLTSSLVSLTTLTLGDFSGWNDLEEGLACLRSLKELVHLDIRDPSFPSGNLVDLLGGLPITGIKIGLDDPVHVSEVAGSLERCVPTTLSWLSLVTDSGDTQPSSSQVLRLLSPLRSAGPQLQQLTLNGFDLSQADSVSIITGLTQLTSLSILHCKFHDDGWALLEPAFAHLQVLFIEKAGGDGMSWFHAEAALLSQV